MSNRFCWFACGIRAALSVPAEFAKEPHVALQGLRVFFELGQQHVGGRFHIGQRIMGSSVLLPTIEPHCGAQVTGFHLVEDPLNIHHAQRCRVPFIADPVQLFGEEGDVETHDIEATEVAPGQFIEHFAGHGVEVCEMLDNGNSNYPYTKALQKQIEAIRYPALTASARMLSTMHDQKPSVTELVLQKSQEHTQYFKHTVLNDSTRKQFDWQAQESIRKYEQLNNTNQIPFNEYLSNYFTGDVAAEGIYSSDKSVCRDQSYIQMNRDFCKSLSCDL